MVAINIGTTTKGIRIGRILASRRLPFGFGNSVESIHCSRWADERCAGIDADRHAERIGNLFPTGTVLMGFAGMNSDAAIASQAGRYGERGEFADFRIEIVGVGSRLAELPIASDSLGTELCETANTSNDLLTVSIPIDLMHRTMSFRLGAVFVQCAHADGIRQAGTAPISPARKSM